MKAGAGLGAPDKLSFCVFFVALSLSNWEPFFCVILKEGGSMFVEEEVYRERQNASGSQVVLKFCQAQSLNGGRNKNTSSTRREQQGQATTNHYSSINPK